MKFTAHWGETDTPRHSQSVTANANPEMWSDIIVVEENQRLTESHFTAIQLTYSTSFNRHDNSKNRHNGG